MQTAIEHEQAGRLDIAEDILRTVLAEVPDHHPALHLLAIVSFKQDKPDDAVQLMERSIALAPTQAPYHRNLCEVYRVVGRLDEALGAGRRAAGLAPDDAYCHHNLGVLHYHRLELDEAIACGERAVSLDPSFPAAHFGIAEASLLRADFERGWEEYEWRMKLGNVLPLLPSTDKPQWDGTPLGDAPLLLIADQGYGDAIQFSRFVSWAAERCPNIVLACNSELHPFVRQLPGVGMIFDRWESAPDFAAYCPLSGLPRLAGTRLDSIPAQVPCARADPERLVRWRARLDLLVPPDYCRIGIVWAGRPTHHNDRNRSMTFATFEPISKIPGVALVSLQQGPSQSQIGTYRGCAPLVDLGPELRDFGDTMAVLECLDRIVTCDTSVGHLAGAMGRETWIMLPYAPDWRWLLDRDDTPWYPTVRLFRQGPDRRYEPIVARIAAELSSMTHGQSRAMTSSASG